MKMHRILGTSLLVLLVPTLTHSYVVQHRMHLYLPHGACHSRHFQKGSLSAHQNLRQEDPDGHLSYPISRKDLIGTLVWSAVSFGCLLTRPKPAFAADKPYNPLNLKGSYWETGQLYEKKRDADLSSDPEDILSNLDDMASSLNDLTGYAERGEFTEMSRMLRGGSVSESKLRLAGNAILDSILDEDRSYEASELFRIFLLRFDALDRTAAAAARKSQVDRGAVSTIGLAAVAPLGAINRISSDASLGGSGGDVRFEVLASIGEASQALRSFNKVARNAIKLEQ